MSNNNDATEKSLTGKTLVIELSLSTDKPRDAALGNLSTSSLALQSGMGHGSDVVLASLLRDAPAKAVFLVENVQAVIEAEDSLATIIAKLPALSEQDERAIRAVLEGKAWEPHPGDAFFDALCRLPADCYGRWSQHKNNERGVILRHSAYRFGPGAKPTTPATPPSAARQEPVAKPVADNEIDPKRLAQAVNEYVDELASMVIGKRQEELWAEIVRGAAASLPFLQKKVAELIQRGDWRSLGYAGVLVSGFENFPYEEREAILKSFIIPEPHSRDYVINILASILLVHALGAEAGNQASRTVRDEMILKHPELVDRVNERLASRGKPYLEKAIPAADEWLKLCNPNDKKDLSKGFWTYFQRSSNPDFAGLKAALASLPAEDQRFVWWDVGVYLKNYFHQCYLQGLIADPRLDKLGTYLNSLLREDGARPYITKNLHAPDEATRQRVMAYLEGGPIPQSNGRMDSQLLEDLEGSLGFPGEHISSPTQAPVAVEKKPAAAQPAPVRAPEARPTPSVAPVQSGEKLASVAPVVSAPAAVAAAPTAQRKPAARSRTMSMVGFGILGIGILMAGVFFLAGGLNRSKPAAPVLQPSAAPSAASSATARPLPTDTPEPSSTPAPTPSPTPKPLAVSFLPVSAWKVVYAEDFNGASAGDRWHVGTSTLADFYEEIKDGKLVFPMVQDGHNGTLVRDVPYFLPELGDFYARVDVEKAEGAASATCSLMYLYQDAFDFYSLDMLGNQAYSVTALVDGNFQQLVPVTTSKAVKSGANTLEVFALGGNLRLFINGEEVYNDLKPAFAQGEVGVLGDTLLNPQALTCRFDNFEVRAP